MSLAGSVAVSKPADTPRPDPRHGEQERRPPSGTTKTDAPLSPPPRNVDKEGGAPVDELDLDGDGARKE